MCNYEQQKTDVFLCYYFEMLRLNFMIFVKRLLF